MAEIKFGTDGWRAIMCDTFILKNVRLVAQAIANYVKEKNGKEEVKSQKSLVVGYDCRFFSEDFAEACVHLFTENKISVYLAKRAIPTPVAAFSIKIYQADGAIMFTASHNPPKYNGIKFIPKYAGPATPEITKEIEKNIQQLVPLGLSPSEPALSGAEGRSLEQSEGMQKNENLPQVAWQFGEKIKNNSLLTLIDPFPDYIAHLKNLINLELFRNKALRLVVDPMYGAGLGILDTILKELGEEVFSLHNFRDPFFGGSLPDPAPENLQTLRSEVLRHQADLGLALDGDGDRFGIIDSRGEYLSPNQVLAILADYLLRIRGLKGLVVRSVATTHLLDIIAKENGADWIETPVGFKYIGQIMLKEPVVLGGEESGGLSILGHIPEKDGILACLLVAEAVNYYQKSLSQILEEEVHERYGRYISKRIDVPCPPKTKEKLLHHLQSDSFFEIGGINIQEKVTIDGVKFLLEEGSWLLARPSGTEPLIRVYIESDSKKNFQALENYIKELFRKFRN